MLALLEITLLAFAGWTLTYQLALLARFPSRPVFIIYTVLLLPLLYFYRRYRWRPARKEQYRRRGSRWFTVGAGGLALAAGFFAIIISRPDMDDLEFFHRGLVQIERPGEPFILYDTIHNLPDLPPISLTHYLTSYEPLAAWAGEITRVGPLQFYHNIGAFIIAALIPIVYILIYREMGIGRLFALLAAGTVLVFLMIDGNLHRSFGNFGLARCWQGKVILIILLTPLTLLTALRFLKSPSGLNLLAVVICGISATGLSGSGIFIIPILIFGISISFLASGGLSRERLIRAGMLNLASGYPIALGATFHLGFIPLPVDTSLWEYLMPWPRNWWSNLSLVIGGGASVFRDLFILLALPIVCLPKSGARFIVSLSLIFIILFANPLLGPRWLALLTPGGYWRLVYLFPLPFCAGLIICCFQRGKQRMRMAGWRYLTAAVVVLSTALAFHSSIFASWTHFKLPFSLRFSPRQLELAMKMDGKISGRNILGPPKAVWVTALLNPDTRFEATRPPLTSHIFRNAGMAGEGERRVAAQNVVWKGKRTPESEDAFRKSLDNGVDAIITIKKHLPVIKDLLDRESGNWQIMNEKGYFILLLKDPPDGEKR
jgi:Family of unknown function (DUF6077)